MKQIIRTIEFRMDGNHIIGSNKWFWFNFQHSFEKCKLNCLAQKCQKYNILDAIQTLQHMVNKQELMIELG